MDIPASSLGPQCNQEALGNADLSKDALTVVEDRGDPGTKGDGALKGPSLPPPIFTEPPLLRTAGALFT